MPSRPHRVQPNLGQRDKPRLATIKHFRSLVPMAQEARKPIFDLTVADGAIGSHAAAVRDARKDFRNLAALLLDLAATSGTQSSFE